MLTHWATITATQDAASVTLTGLNMCVYVRACMRVSGWAPCMPSPHPPTPLPAQAQGIGGRGWWAALGAWASGPALIWLLRLASCVACLFQAMQRARRASQVRGHTSDVLQAIQQRMDLLAGQQQLLLAQQHALLMHVASSAGGGRQQQQRQLVPLAPAQGSLAPPRMDMHPSLVAAALGRAGTPPTVQAAQQWLQHATLLAIPGAGVMSPDKVSAGVESQSLQHTASRLPQQHSAVVHRAAAEAQDHANPAGTREGSHLHADMPLPSAEVPSRTVSTSATTQQRKRSRGGGEQQGRGQAGSGISCSRGACS